MGFILDIFFALCVGFVSCDTTFDKLVDDFWEWRMVNNPEFASNVGDHRFTDRLEDYKIEAIDERKVDIEGFVARLQTVDRDALNSGGRVTYDVLHDTLQTWLDGYKWRYYGPMNPVNILEGLHTTYGSRDGQVKFVNETDFSRFAARIGAYGIQLDEIIARMNKSIEMETTNHFVSIDGIPEKYFKVYSMYKDNVTAFPMYRPFIDDIDAKVLDSSRKQEIRTLAQQNIGTLLNKMKELGDFLNNTYSQHTRSGFGVWSLPNGLDYYKACLKWQLSVTYTPEEIHQKGLTEVARVYQNLNKIVQRANFSGTVQEFNEYIRNNNSNFITDGNAAIEQFRKIYQDRIVPKLTKMFQDIPDVPLSIEEMTYDGPLGIYKNGAPDGSRPGVFFANVLSKVPKFDMAALLTHETDPGHHLQDAYALTSEDIPMFRKATDFSKYFAVPLHFPFYTAYSEGWGLYSEDLGEELNIYENDLERFGKYGLEIFRAARLVVDTGIHAKQWTRDRAIEYMKNYTAYPENTIAREIDRYSTWPGQATSYMIGKLKIWELRDDAQRRLGDYFDIRGFHGVLLKNGAMPLSVMENVVNEWIQKVRKQYGLDDVNGTGTVQASVTWFTIMALLITRFIWTA